MPDLRSINLFQRSPWHTAGVLIGVFLLSPLAFAAKSTAPDPELRELLTKAANESYSFSDRFQAEVWLMDMSSRLQSFIEDDATRISFLKSVHYEATRANLPPELVLAVIHIESRFNRWAISSVGAQGLMQVMPFWLKEIGREKDNLFEVKTNLRFGCTILKHYLNKEKGDLVRALARYNGSLGQVKYPNKVLKQLQNRWFRR